MSESTTSPDAPFLDILVPTYQRTEALRENLRHLTDVIAGEASEFPPGAIRILVRDNGSTDGTADHVRAFMRENPNSPIVFHANETNVGLERNCVDVLVGATARYVMYVGDDDFIAQGYLRFVLDEIAGQPETALIISGYSFLLPDGTLQPERFESFDVRRYPSSIENVRLLMPLGHQLSGLVFRRQGMADAYLARPDCRNMYPFIYFAGYSAQRGDGVYAPKFQARVSKVAVRHWAYDKSDLLRDVFANYRSLFEGQPWQRFRAQFAFLRRNWGRVGGENIFRLPLAFTQIFFWPGLDGLTRLGLIAVLPFLIVRATLFSIPKAWRAVTEKLRT